MPPDWEMLARFYGPQTAPYMHDAEWDGKTRSIRCGCGAIIEILADEPSDGHECDVCTLRRAFTMEEHYQAHRETQPTTDANQEAR